MLHARRPRDNWHQQFTTGTQQSAVVPQGPRSHRILQKHTYTHMHTPKVTMESNRVLWKDVTLHVIPRNSGTVTQ